MGSESDQVTQGFNASVEMVSGREAHIKITATIGMSKLQLATMLVSVADEILKDEAGIGDREQPTERK